MKGLVIDGCLLIYVVVVPFYKVIHKTICDDREGLQLLIHAFLAPEVGVVSSDIRNHFSIYHSGRCPFGNGGVDGQALSCPSIAMLLDYSISPVRRYVSYHFLQKQRVVNRKTWIHTLYQLILVWHSSSISSSYMLPYLDSVGPDRGVGGAVVYKNGGVVLPFQRLPPAVQARGALVEKHLARL